MSEGLPVIDVPESEEITVAVKPDDLAEGDMDDPERHPIAIALRRRKGINDARAPKREVLTAKASVLAVAAHSVFLAPKPMLWRVLILSKRRL